MTWPWKCALNCKKHAAVYTPSGPYNAKNRSFKRYADTFWKFQNFYQESLKPSWNLWNRRTWPTLNTPTGSDQKRHSDLVFGILGLKKEPTGSAPLNCSAWINMSGHVHFTSLNRLWLSSGGCGPGPWLRVRIYTLGHNYLGHNYLGHINLHVTIHT